MFKKVGSQVSFIFQKELSRGINIKPNGNPTVQYYVRGIPLDIDPHRVKELFSRKIPIHFCNVPKDDDGKHKGFCYVTLNQDQVDWFATVVSKMEFDGKKLSFAPANHRISIPIGRRNPG